MSAASHDDEMNTRDNLIKIFRQNEEEYTDISDAADESSDSSAPSEKPEKMEEIYSTKDKHVKYKKLAPIEEEAAQKRKNEAKKDLIDGKMEIAPDDEKPDEGGCASAITMGASAMMLLAAAWVTTAARKKED